MLEKNNVVEVPRLRGIEPMLFFLFSAVMTNEDFIHCSEKCSRNLCVKVIQ